ncbi:MAG: fibronectin type III domain-containing protein [Dehalococcoidia bacterium]|nr:fibronectin type III domain-containing protein [Dehalococcoidia bacterium]
MQQKARRGIISMLLSAMAAASLFMGITPGALAAEQTALAVSYLTLAPGSDETQLTFSWHTAVRSENPVVRIWEDGEEAREFIGTCSSSASSVSTMYYNGVTVSGLVADTAYTYQVGDGNDNWSAEYATKTGNPDAFSYIVVGDPQIGSSNVTTDTNAWVNTMNLVAEYFPNAAFLAGTGDQIETSGTLSHYTGFFTPSQMASLPFASCMGNHEGSGAATRTFYNPPNSDSVQNYWYRYGNVLFMVWNCTTGSPSTMRTFLQSAIDANPDATWTILNFHYDVYGQGSSHALSDGKNYRDQYVPVIDEFDIDVVFNGHDHSYSRSYPMIYSGSSSTSNSLYIQPETFGPNGESIDPTGTVYFSLNSSTGSKYYSLIAQQAYTAKMQQSNRPQFSVVDVTANSFTCTTYQIEANNTLTIIDAYTIVKTNGAVDPKVPAELILSTNKYIVRPDEYFNVSVSFAEQMEANVVKLDFTFDGSKFDFAAYIPADSATLLTREYGEGYASVVVMVPNYDMESLGELMLKANTSVVVGSSTIAAVATFVERDENLEKSIKEASGSYVQKTSNVGTDGYVVDMIVLSNLIDAFGMTSDSSDWESYSYFDINGNGEIDIFDIANLAQMIQ